MLSKRTITRLTALVFIMLGWVSLKTLGDGTVFVMTLMFGGPVVLCPEAFK